MKVGGCKVAYMCFRYRIYCNDVKLVLFWRSMRREDKFFQIMIFLLSSIEVILVLLFFIIIVFKFPSALIFKDSLFENEIFLGIIFLLLAVGGFLLVRFLKKRNRDD